MQLHGMVRRGREIVADANAKEVYSLCELRYLDDEGGGDNELERGSRSESMSLQLVLVDGCFMKESPHVASSDFSGEKSILGFSLKFSDLKR